ncbi:hypothetical protein [Solidesulfovibrio sp.]|jgi:hypothetical protein|uniref:hypothetical protein n=1 Tax=Solidesulfovibrio sp. TaxID=2910990 RepID=UPI002B215FA7|nr:hypothetical protein [Solidesulfovibrio sp.]MEA4855660.1 hypothetical protein [Solidesulfovibrio sp.]
MDGRDAPPLLRREFLRLVTRSPKSAPLLVLALERTLSALPAGSRLALYGCGTYAQALVDKAPQALRRLDVCFVTSDPAGQTDFRGFPLCAPQALQDAPPAKVVLLSATYGHEMRARLPFLPPEAIIDLEAAVAAYGLDALYALAAGQARKRARTAAARLARTLPNDRKLILFMVPKAPQHLIKTMRAVRRQGQAVVLAVQDQAITQDVGVGGYVARGVLDGLHETGVCFSLECLELARLLRPHCVHAVAGMWNNEGLAAFLAHTDRPTVVEYCDIKQLVFKNDADARRYLRQDEAEYAAERQAAAAVYTGARGVIIKESPEVIDALAALHGGHRPPAVLRFAHYVSPELLAPPGTAKLSETDGGFHFVYAGGLGNDPAWHNYPVCRSLLAAAKILEAQGIHLDVYNASDATGAGFEDFVRLGRTSRYFRYHFAVPYERLREVLPRYDCGWFCFDFSRARENPLFYRTAMGSKIFAYLESGLPVAVAPQQANMLDFVTRHGIGLGLDFTDLPRLAAIVAATDWAAFGPPIERARRELTYERHAPRLTAFYEQLSRLP